MKIKDLLIKNYSLILNNDRSKEKTFYEYVKRRLDEYKKDLDLIDENEIVPLLSEYNYNGSRTKKRFINMMSIIIDKCIKMLQYCYKGDFWKAGNLLEELLLSKHKLKRYLTDHYINDFNTIIPVEKVFYRMLDCKNNEIPEDCWHVRYEERYKASFSRYSFAGVPALYLADSKITADEETGDLKSGYKRWFSEFRLKKELHLLDMRVPDIEKVLDMNKIDLIESLTTYPIRLLCSTKTINAGNCEEYFVPQLICHWLSRENTDRLMSFSGIAYDSTVNVKGQNYILPAFYDSLEPIKGHSPVLLDLFETTKPNLYNTNLINYENN